MDMQDRVFIALLSTLFLFVVALEWHKRWKDLPRHVQPVPAGVRLLERTNIPENRDDQSLVDDVADAQAWGHGKPDGGA
jgi:hypothetical protein